MAFAIQLPLAVKFNVVSYIMNQYGPMIRLSETKLPFIVKTLTGIPGLAATQDIVTQR